MKTEGQCVVVRHCSIKFGGREHEVWPGASFFLSKHPEKPGEYLIAAAEDGKPIGVVPGNVVLSLAFDTKHEIYVVDRVASTKRFLMKGVRTRDAKEAKPENFMPKFREAPDIVEAVQSSAFHWYPAVGQFMPVPTNADIEGAKA